MVMARTSRLMRAFALLALLSATAVQAQNDLPNLSTVTGATSNTAATTTGGTTAATTTGGETSATTVESTTGATTAESSSAASTGETTSAASTFNPTGISASGTTTTGSSSVFQLTGLPTIAGAGIPELVIPYTANAPFMQKSSMPEGTVFIAVGACLAFLGACVLLWRGLVAWSINRSVKKAALASIRGSEKNGSSWGVGAGYGQPKAAYYKEHDMGSSMSLDHLTSTGKTQKKSDGYDMAHRNSTAPPAGLFFSPTAQAQNRASSYSEANRGSSYLPAGYYASPSADAPAGGRNSTVIGGSLAPYARHSTVGHSPSPPGSPSLPNSRSTSNYYGGPGASSREGLRASSRDGLRVPSRDGYGGRNSYYNNPSTSSLMVGQSSSDLPGSRAPSAVLDELFENHGNGPRERF